MKMEIQKHNLFLSIMTAVLVMAFALAAINPALAVGRQDGPTSVTDSWMGAYVGVELTGFYQMEPPSVNTYTAGAWHAWRVTNNPMCHLAGNLWVHFWLDIIDEVPNGVELPGIDEISVVGDTYNAHVIYGSAGTWCWDEYSWEGHYIRADNALTAHYP